MRLEECQRRPVANNRSTSADSIHGRRVARFERRSFASATRGPDCRLVLRLQLVRNSAIAPIDRTARRTLKDHVKLARAGTVESVVSQRTGRYVSFDSPPKMFLSPLASASDFECTTFSSSSSMTY